jgi:transposase
MSSEKSRRRWTASEKLAIVAEARKEGSSVSEVCRRHAIAPTMFYDWERKINEGATARLSPASRAKRKPEPTIQELEAEILRLKGVIIEIAAENVEMKKKGWHEDVDVTAVRKSRPKC